MKRIMVFFLINLWLVGTYSAVLDKTKLQPKLVLDYVAVIKTQERDNDELYLDIKIHRPNHFSQYFRVPKSPVHWSSRVIGRIKDLQLWSEPLASGDSITLIISLIEGDDSVVDPDDLIGLVQVRLKNQKGHLQTLWSMPNQANGGVKKVSQTGNVKKIDLMGSDAHYQLYLSVKQ